MLCEGSEKSVKNPKVTFVHEGKEVEYEFVKANCPKEASNMEEEGEEDEEIE